MTKREKEYMSLYGWLSYQYCHIDEIIEKSILELPKGSDYSKVYDKFVPRRVKIERLIYKIEKKFDL